ncbi:MAG TPA: hypothetical protein VJ867_16625, partial [Gemmatimonadaceae bacterium]|nr:hypothetical protein [Gemmatimonadaceae bacterium]
MRGLGLALTSAYLAGTWVFVASALVFGVRGDCGCFGAFRSTPLDAGTLLRVTGMLLVSATTAAVVLAPLVSLATAGPLPIAGLGLLSIAGTVAAVAVVLLLRRVVDARVRVTG